MEMISQKQAKLLEPEQVKLQKLRLNHLLLLWEEKTQ